METHRTRLREQAWLPPMVPPARRAQRPQNPPPLPSVRPGAATARETLEDDADAGVKRSAKDITDEAKRMGRRRRTEILDFGLELVARWYRDLAASASGAAEVVYNLDRLGELQRRGAKVDSGRYRRAVELVEDTRRRLELNVSEELALEALAFRLGRVFS